MTNPYKPRKHAQLLIEFKDAQHVVGYRELTPTGLAKGPMRFILGRFDTHNEAREYLDRRKGRVKWSDGCVARMAALDRALDKLEVR